MSRIRILMMAAIAALLMTAVAVGQGSDALSDEHADDIEVTGMVYSETMNSGSPVSAPLTGAVVSIEWSTGHSEAMTSTSGIFEIKGVPADEALDITFAYPGKTVTRWYSNVMSAGGEDDSFRLILPQSSAGICDISGYPVTMRDTSLELQVMNESSRGNIPLADTAVIITDAFGQIDTGTTDSEGRVSLSIGSVYGLKLGIGYPDGYSFVPGLFFMNVESTGGAQHVSFDLKGSYGPLGAEYSIPMTDYTNERIYSIGDPVLVSASTATVSITVRNGGGTPLEGATVTLQHKEDSGIRYTSITDKNGVATFDAVTTTVYHLSVEVNGFERYDGGDVEISKGAIPLPDAVMTAKTVTTWFGMNLGHVMMLFGIVIGVVLAIISILLFTRHLRGHLEEDEPE